MRTLAKAGKDHDPSRQRLHTDLLRFGGKGNCIHAILSENLPLEVPRLLWNTFSPCGRVSAQTIGPRVLPLDTTIFSYASSSLQP